MPVAPVRFELVKFVLVKRAPIRFARFNLDWLTLASVKLATYRTESIKSDFVKLAPLIFAPIKFVPDKSALDKSAPLNWAKRNYARLRLAQARFTPSSFIPSSLMQPCQSTLGPAGSVHALKAATQEHDRTVARLNKRNDIAICFIPIDNFNTPYSTRITEAGLKPKSAALPLRALEALALFRLRISSVSSRALPPRPMPSIRTLRV